MKPLFRSTDSVWLSVSPFCASRDPSSTYRNSVCTLLFVATVTTNPRRNPAIASSAKWTKSVYDVTRQTGSHDATRRDQERENEDDCGADGIDSLR